MKTFVGISIALVAIAASSFVAASADPVYYAPPAPPVPVARLQLGTLLKKCITTLAQQIVVLLSNQVTAVVPGSTAVSVPQLVTALQSLKSANVATVLNAVSTLLGKNLSSISAVLPKIVATLSINIPNLLNFLVSNLPPNCTTVALANLLSLLGAYVVQLAVTVLVNVLNSLS